MMQRLTAIITSTAVESALIVRVRPEMSNKFSKVLKDILTPD